MRNLWYNVVVARKIFVTLKSQKIQKQFGGKKMNKSEFIRAYADKLGVTIKEAENYYQTLVETLTEQMKKGDYVHISGFATFEVKKKDARVGVNPKTGDKITIEACNSPTVKFSKAYKDLFN